MPTHIQTVTFPTGTKLRQGTVGPQNNWPGSPQGGGFQVDTLGQIIDDIDFGALKPLVRARPKPTPNPLPAVGSAADNESND